MSPATDAGHATEGAVEEDLTDNDSTKDPIFMPGRHDIDSDWSASFVGMMFSGGLESSNVDVNELFRPPNLQSKEAKEMEGSINTYSIQALADQIHSNCLD